MKPLLYLVASSTLLLFSQSLLADTNKFSFNAPLSYAGTGCVGSTVTPERKADTLSANFTGYDASKDKPSASGIPISSCNFALPIQLPPGFKISFKIDWQGRVQGKGSFKRKYTIAGQSPQPWMTNEYSQDFTVQDSFAPSLGCNGGEFMLRISSNITAESNSHIALDKIQIVAIQMQPC